MNIIVFYYTHIIPQFKYMGLSENRVNIPNEIAI